mgnify:CR=1 FL=1
MEHQARRLLFPVRRHAMRRGVRYCAVLVFLDGRSAAVFASDYCTADPKRIKAVSRKALATAREFGLSGRCFAVTDTVANSFGIADVLAAGLTKAGYEVRRESYRGKFIKRYATPPGGPKSAEEAAYLEWMREKPGIDFEAFWLKYADEIDREQRAIDRWEAARR